ncbi:hypothetical protein CQ13_38460 [Bradyrhizobium retamae]|uniref:Cytochrome n=2 Tax=Bradyrhizobium retamae TaxID=1300035 RepID=A0A0R3NHG4_9BRAD|nr:hypothetical protein CQ13_38460 [Bradyrhizobium retamae]
MLSLADKDPFTTYDVLRERGPIIWDPGMKCWIVLRYDICKMIESDDETYAALTPLEDSLSLEIRGGRPAVSTLTGEEHTRMRRLYLKLLGPRVMPQYRDEHIIPVVNYVIDRFAEKRSAELFDELVEPLPPRIMASLFGLPWKDDALMADIAEWNQDMVAWIYNKSSEELTRKAKRASGELNRLFLPLVLERREKRGSDFISQIWTRAPEDWGEVSVNDVMAIVRDASLGAGDTTTNAIANMIYLFLSQPAVREAVTKDQGHALNALVEETLRLLGALQWRFRKVNRDVSIAGTSIKKDELVCLLHAAANRDPQHYACPHVVDLKRKTPTDHLSFNVGSRICPGMFLARLKMRECMKALIRRFPELHLDPSKEAPRFLGFSHRRYSPLHVAF